MKSIYVEVGRKPREELAKRLKLHDSQLIRELNSNHETGILHYEESSPTTWS